MGTMKFNNILIEMEKLTAKLKHTLCPQISRNYVLSFQIIFIIIFFFRG